MSTNKLITRITTIQELKTWFLERVFNNTSKVTKASKTSVINAVAYGVAKIGQKAIKDIAVLESQIFPEMASGQYLDEAARVWYGQERLQSSQSSVFVRVKASPETVYKPGVHTFMSDTGIEFNVVQQVTVDVNGYAYVNCRSIVASESSNVSPMSVNKVLPIPDGHISCTNEYSATGGRDSETDEIFRNRVVNAKNLFSRDTIGYVNEILRIYDPNIYQVINSGLTDNYEVILQVLKNNGTWYTNAELVEIKEFLSDYLSMNDSLGILGSGVVIRNTDWYYIDIDFRAEILSNYGTDEVRKDIQISLTKFFDISKGSKKILWDDLLEIVKNVDGVVFVPVEFFNPSVNNNIPFNQFPRIRSFVMRDLQGSIIFDSMNKVSPIFYQ